MKKALSIILSLVLVIAALPLAAVESTALVIQTSQDGLWMYYINTDGATVTINSGGSSKAYLGTDTDVTVPSTIDGYPVMIVGNYAFYNYTDLESVTIPNTVTAIGNNAFQNCSTLTDVDMGSGVLTIGSSAFANCTSLEEIEIGSSVQTINGGAFQACSNLKKVVIPPSVTTINGRYTFYQCNTDLKTYITDLAAWCKINFNGGSGDYGSNPLESGHNLYIYDSIADDYILAENIVIPSGITSISAGAFNCCTSIKSVVIPEGVTTINQYSFRGCSNLESVTIPSTLTTLNSSGIFVGCTSLNAVYITDVAAWCNINFANTEANPLTYAHNLYVNGVLSTVTIPGTVSEIKKYAFYGLANDVAFSEGLQKIGNFAFYNATGIDELVLPNSLTTVDNSVFYNCTALESVTFGSGLATIGNSMFRGCTALESITIPNTVTAIGNNAFQNCSSLADVDMGTGVTSVGSSAFAGCTSLEEIEIGSSVQTINGGAFNGCSNLKKVVIPPSVTTINGRYTFYNCHADLKTYITDLEAWCKINFNSGNGDYAANPLEYGHKLYLNGNLVENLVIPSGITSIPAGAFHCCTSIKSVVIPEGVTTINQYAFRNCSNLESITIPSSLTTVSGANVFSGCSSLNAVYITDVAAWCNISFTSNSYESNPLYFAHNLYVNGVLSTITIPGTVSEIKPYTFYGLANDVAFSEGLQKIGNCAFYNATGIDELVLPNSLTTVGNSVFYNCTALESVTFGSGLATIGNSMFCGCTALESTIIPDTVTAIGNSAFQNCSALADVDMGSGVTTIGSNAFANCTSLEEIEIGSSVQTINGGAFQACSNLKKVVIPPSVTTINGRYTFYNCHADLKTYITDLTEWCNISFNGGSGDYASNPTEYGRKLYLNNELVTELVIPGDVTKISAGAFHGCTGITKVTVPASVTSINQFAFRRCSDMKHLIVAGQSVNLGSRALEGCDSLEHIYCYIGSNAASFNSSKTAYLGDMNTDGVIDVLDVADVMSVASGNTVLNDEVLEIAADYNLDGAVDGFDAAAIDRYFDSVIHPKKVSVSNLEQLQTALNTDYVREVIVTTAITLPDGTVLDGAGKTVRVEKPYVREDGTLETSATPSRVFSIESGSHVSISNMTVMGGEKSGTAAISLIHGYLTMENVNVVRSNRGLDSNGTAVLKNCNFSLNVCKSAGAIWTGSGAILVLDGCSFTENRSNGGSSYGGGAIGLSGSGSYLYANNTVFANNASQEIGGAINVYDGNAYLMNCTVAGNCTSNSASYGGGIGKNGGSFYAVNCLFTDNYATIKSTPTRSDIGKYSGSNSVLYNCLYGTLQGSATANDCKTDLTATVANEYANAPIILSEGTMSVNFIHPVLSDGTNGYLKYVPVNPNGNAATGGVSTYFDYSDINNVKMGYGTDDNIVALGGLTAPDSGKKVTSYLEGGVRDGNVIGASACG